MIVILATGGTIAGRAERAGSVANYNAGVIRAEDLLEAAPGLGEAAEVRCRQVANIGSENMTEAVWFALARAAEEELAKPGVDGVAVLHGTDTMEETACFLDLLGLGAEKPVVLTGAMRPADAVSADGPANILAAVRVAACPDSAGRGVLVAFNDGVHLARRVYKADSLNVAAFRSTGGGAAGAVVDGKVYFYDGAGAGTRFGWSLPEGAAGLPEVEVLYGHAGQRRGAAEAVLGLGAAGVVHAGMGMGNIHCEVRPVLAAAAERGVAVACSSRVPGGRSVHREKNRRDGFVSTGLLNPQKSRVLLQLALSRTRDRDAIQEMFDAYQ